MHKPRPPHMKAPDPSKPGIPYTARISFSPKRCAEIAVVEAAKQFVASDLKVERTATEAGEVKNRLVDSVRILKQLEDE